MPQGFSSAARNLFLLGSTGQEVVTNFFRRNSNPIDASTSRTITALKHDDDDGLYRIAGNIETTDSGTPQVGFLTTITSSGTEAPGTNTRKISSSVVNGVGDVSINALHYAPSDGDLYVVGGRKRSDEKYPYIYKMLSNGNPEWSISSRRGEAEYHDICVGSDNKIYVVGHTTEHSGKNGTALIESITELADGTDGYYGDWSTVVSFEGRDIVLTSCGMVGSDTLVACGWISEDISDKGYIVKVDTTDGTILWEKTLEYFLREEEEYLNIKCSDVFLDDNGQIYVTANGDRLGNPPIKGFLLKYTAEGNVIWQKESPFVSITEGFSFDKVIADTETEQVVVLGGVNAGETGLITKYTKSGEQSWRRTITPDTNPSGVNFRSPVLDGDPSFYYLGFVDDPGSNDSYIFGSVSSSGNGLGSFEYDPDGGTTTISYVISSTQDVIGRINDGSVQNNSSDLITYPFTANKILFDDLATNLSHKKRRSDSATPTLIFNGDTWRPVDPTEVNLNGDEILEEVTTGSGNVDESSESKITSSDGASGDRFGNDVAVGSNKIVVSAHLDDDNGGSSGSAYIYDLDGTNEVKVTASDGSIADQFAFSVAVGSDKVVVGSPFDDDNGSSSGSAYIYDLDGTGEVKITASDGLDNDRYGYAVAVGNNKVVIGAPNDDTGSNTDQGAVYIYNLDGTGEIKVTNSDAANGDKFGISVAVGSNKVVVGTDTKDAVYVYDLDGSNEVKITTSTPSEFGYAVAVGENKIVVGDYGDNSSAGAVYVYDLDGSNELKITASDGATGDRLGLSVAIGNGKIVAGAQRDDDVDVDAGTAYVFDLDGTNEVKLIPDDGVSNHYFGQSVAVGDNKVVVGERATTTPGGAYVYTISPSTTTTQYWVDLSGNDYNTTLVNGPINVRYGTTDQLGYWEFFGGPTGSDDYIIVGEVGNTSQFNWIHDRSVSDWAIEGWFWNDRDEEYGAMISNNSGTSAVGFYMGHRNDDQFECVINKGTMGTPACKVLSTNLLDHNTWHHIAFVNDNFTIKMYVNGVLQSNAGDQNSFSAGSTADAQTDLRIGKLATSSQWNLDGRIGELRIYKGISLTAGQVFQNYNHNRSKYGGVRVDNTQLNNTTF